ncbi:MAG: outer membrane protein assembly factor BamB family protein, partial [Planctomycetota bacterium]
MLNYSKLLVFVLLGASLVCAGEWPHWRGPNFNGTTDETDLPTNWGRTENIAWTADLPGSSAATPIIWGGRVFISGLDASRDDLLAMCFDRKSGNLLWKHKIADGIRRDDRSTFAASSPVTDGKIVVFFYSRGELACFNVDGSPRWKRNLHDDYGEFAIQWTPASSPTIFDDKLFIQVLQRDVAVWGHGMEDKVNEPYILAVNPATGKTLWRHIRPSKAVGESR